MMSEVYVVMISHYIDNGCSEEGYDDVSIDSIWSDEELAVKRVDKIKENPNVSDDGYPDSQYGVWIDNYILNKPGTFC